MIRNGRPRMIPSDLGNPANKQRRPGDKFTVGNRVIYHRDGNAYTITDVSHMLPDTFYVLGTGKVYSPETQLTLIGDEEPETEAG